MATSKIFEHRSTMSATPEQMMALHSDPAALYKLTPPPIFIQPLRDDRTSITAGEFEFRLWLGPIPIRWLTRHEPGPIPTSFVDRMLSGPMARWEHRHIFQPVPGGVELIDHLTIEHKPGLPGIFSRLIRDGLPLRFLFIYRHWRTRQKIGYYTQKP